MIHSFMKHTDKTRIGYYRMVLVVLCISFAGFLSCVNKHTIKSPHVVAQTVTAHDTLLHVLPVVQPIAIPDSLLSPAVRTLRMVDTLMAHHKYKSAYDTLENTDPQNINPDFAVKKSLLALRYYVNTDRHRVFGFKDLRMDQTMDDIFGRPDIIPKYTLPIDSIMLAYFRKDTTRCDVTRILGEYYNDIKFRYPKDWPISQDSLSKLVRYYCNKAIQGGCGDWKTYAILADYTLRDSNAVLGFNYLSTSVKLNDSMPGTLYNLAYLYFKKAEYDSTIQLGRRAMYLFKVPLQKGNACSMVTESYKRLGKKDIALKYCDTILILDTLNADSRGAAMNFYFDLGQYDSAQKQALKLYNLAPDAPENLNVVVGAFIQFKQQDSLPAFFARILKDRTDPQVLGNIYFHRGVYFLETGKPEECNESLKISRSYFAKDSVKNKDVLSVIEQQLKKPIDQKK